MVRAPYFDKDGFKKGAWSREEDHKLEAYIERYGHWNWRELPKFAGLQRCGKSCRLRWMNYLRPNVKRGNFTGEEEDIILKLHAELGNKWSIIATKLPGRTDNEIKNHWHTHLKKRAMENKGMFDGKDQSKEMHPGGHFPNYEASHQSYSKAENIIDDAFSHPILESYHLPPEPSSSDMSISYTTNELPQLPHTDQVRDNIVMQEEFLDVGGDFWTEPFVAESNAYLHNNFQLSFEGGQFNLPHASFYDDQEDLLYQVMKEFPEI